MSDSEQQKALDEIAEELDMITGDIKLIADYAKDFPQSGQDTFNKKINNFVSKLDDILKLSQSKELKNIQVPLSVVSYVDANISPLEYNEDISENIVRLNLKFQNTTTDLGKLKTVLKTELEKQFPEEMEKYDEEIQKRMEVPLTKENAEDKPNSENV